MAIANVSDITQYRIITDVHYVSHTGLVRRRAIESLETVQIYDD